MKIRGILSVVGVAGVIVGGVALAGALAGAGNVVPQAATVLTAAATANADGAFTIDNVHSTVIWRIKHLGVSYSYGRFDKISGSFIIDPADASKNSIDVTVATDSINSANGKRDEHLKSPDFFSAKEFGTLTFKSKSFKKGAEVNGEQSYDVVGELTLLGKTKEITVQVRDTGRGPGMRGGEVSGVETTFTIKRSDFGMNYLVGKGLSDEVQITVALEGGR